MAPPLTVQQLRDSLPYISQTALAAVCKCARHAGLPRIASRTPIVRARSDACEQLTPYGPLHQPFTVPLANGNELELEIQHPFAMLWHLSHTSVTWAKLMEKTVQQHGCTPESPLSLILYNDGITPGNAVAFRNGRKLEALYWTIKQFGLSCLQNEEAWLEILVTRAKTAKSVLAGMAGILKALVYIFWAADGFNALTGGISLDLATGGRLHVFLRLEILMSDEAALHALLDCKGSAGLRNCPVCINIVNAHNKRGIEQGRLIHHTCADAAAFQPLDLAFLASIVTRLTEASTSLGSDAFKELQKRLGWSYIPGSWLLDPYCLAIVDPGRTLVWDPLHMFYVDGVANKHLAQFESFLKSVGFGYSHMRDYVDSFLFPRRVKMTGKDALTPKRVATHLKAGSFKAQASETRSLLPVLALYVRNGFLKSTDKAIQAHAVCFLMLFQIVFLVEATERGNVQPLELLNHCQNYLKMYQSLYGTEGMTIKFHWLLHLFVCLHRHGCIPNCFTLERKHKNAKRFANHSFKTGPAFDRNILREITARHIGIIDEALKSSLMINPRHQLAFLS